MMVQVASASPRKGQTYENTSKHVFGVFSYEHEDVFIEISDLAHEALGVDDAHLRKQCMSLCTIYNTDRWTQRMLTCRSCEWDDEARLGAVSFQDEYGPAMFATSTVLLETDIHAERTPPYLAGVVERTGAVLVNIFLLIAPGIKIFLHVGMISRAMVPVSIADDHSSETVPASVFFP